ncbi:hypothetical protein C882_0231 [Caenispirillum salinarum AK4]|uniref:Uncharacterized protein n=1 Tax=Caenispirillum salinarum AK4 TaxID=1238182 RepID=K9HMN4_9PROT|nr:hypothetical protein C882_0231 [Caenispirillum salinarum AK4]
MLVIGGAQFHLTNANRLLEPQEVPQKRCQTLSPFRPATGLQREAPVGRSLEK